jgi:anti-sigma factor RsiW
MNCGETKEVIHSYVDGELDLVRSLGVEQHLSECQACAQAHRELRALRTAVAGGALYFSAPKGLERRVRLALPKVEPGKNRAARWPWYWNWSWPTVLPPLAMAALVMLITLPLATRHSANSLLAEEILSAHVRSLMVETSHLTDVSSSDQHTVKPWFNGKLDFSPPVVNLPDRGFPLVGGRLDYVHGRPVAALVYQRRKHLINLFIWPASTQSNTPKQSTVLQGYNEVHWDASGMTFWAVSDLNRAELTDFAELIK